MKARSNGDNAKRTISKAIDATETNLKAPQAVKINCTATPVMKTKRRRRQSEQTVAKGDRRHENKLRKRHTPRKET